MTARDALAILGLSGNVTTETIKAAYHTAAFQFHPDVNPAGEEMMKVINEAYASLGDFAGYVEEQSSATQAYPAALNEAIIFAVNLDNISLEVCGAWLWVTGNTYPYRAEFKAHGFYFAGAKKAWYYRPPEWKSSNRHQMTLDEIRERHGSYRPEVAAYQRIVQEEERTA